AARGARPGARGPERGGGKRLPGPRVGNGLRAGGARRLLGRGGFRTGATPRGGGGIPPARPARGRPPRGGRREGPPPHRALRLGSRRRLPRRLRRAPLRLGSPAVHGPPRPVAGSGAPVRGARRLPAPPGPGLLAPG